MSFPSHTHYETFFFAITCSDEIEVYPDVYAPTEETNIANDPAAANFVIDGRFSPFDTIYFVPVAVANKISGDDYIKIVNAGRSGSNRCANTTIDFYRAWSAAARNDTQSLLHAEAMKYDPEIEAPPQYDACAVMLALQLLDDDSCQDRMKVYDVEGVHFLDGSDSGLKSFPERPRTAFSLFPQFNSLTNVTLPAQCPALTPFTFNPDETPEVEKPVKVALGFATLTAKDNFFAEMAERMAGLFPRSKNDRCMKGNYGKKFRQKYSFVCRGVDHFSLTPASTFTEFKKGCLKNPL